MKKLKIILTTNNVNKQFYGRDNEPLGGAYYVTIALAKELAKYGHKVYSFHNMPDKSAEGIVIDGVKMVDRKWLKQFLSNGHTDIFIGEREMPIVRSRFDIDVVCYHIHNTPGAEHPKELIEWHNMKAIDKVIYVSKWHRDLTKGLPDSAKHVIPNGTHLYDVKGAKKKYRLIWASNPTRGLSIVANDIFPLIKKQIPKAELHVAGSHEIYNHSKEKAREKNKASYECLFSDIYGGKLKPGIKWYGALSQRQLAQFYHEGSLLVYPISNRSETGCVVAVQSMTYLNPVIVKKICVFPELVGNRGYLMSPTSPAEYYADIAINLLQDRDEYKKFQKHCKKWREKYLWSNIVAKVNRDFQEWCS